MSLNVKLPEKTIIKPQITVFGVGGAGGNATNNMIQKSLQGARFVVANTDAQALEYSESEHRIQLGESTTKGLGAGASPDVGKRSAEETNDEIQEHLQGSNMVFITAGMGGGTGTGAAPVIAKVAREMGILTVGVVTKPFHFEGPHRMRLAEAGIAELQNHVDTLIIIPNQNLFRIANEKTTFADAFAMADEVLYCGVRSITDLMIMPGLINLDFADVKAVMTEMGKAMMGTGEAEGENRAEAAAAAAISNPLLDNTSMKGARGVLINITGGPDMTLFEVDEAANRIRKEVDENANIIFGSAFDESLEGKLRVSVVATGIGDTTSQVEQKPTAAYQFKETVQQRTIASAPTLREEPSDEEATYDSPSFHAEEEDDEETALQLQPETTESPSLAEIRESLFEEAIITEPVKKKKVFVPRTPVDPGISPNTPRNFELSEEQSFGRTQPAKETNAQPQRSGGFFSKFAAVAKSLQSGSKRQDDLWEDDVDDELNTITSRVNKAIHKNLGEAETREEENESFDIPAFLRRKD